MCGLKLIAQERLAEDDETFLWKLCPDWVNPVETLHHSMEPPNLPIYKADARICAVGGSLGWRRGVHGLPGQGDSTGWVEGEKIVEESSPCPGQPSDEDGPTYFFLNDPSILLTVLLHPYMVDKESD
jgi:hypothetical protein